VSEVREKVAYLKGLLAGLGKLEDPASAKIWEAVLDVFDTVADELEILDDDLEDLGQYVSSIDDDLAEVEDNLYEDYVDDESDDTIAIECDTCGHEFSIPEYKLYNDEDVVCPECNTSIYDDLDDDDDVEIGFSDEE
jgi:hypothetical protein